MLKDHLLTFNRYEPAHPGGHSAFSAVLEMSSELSDTCESYAVPEDTIARPQRPKPYIPVSQPQHALIAFGIARLDVSNAWSPVAFDVVAIGGGRAEGPSGEL